MMIFILFFLPNVHDVGALLTKFQAKDIYIFSLLGVVFKSCKHSKPRTTVRQNKTKLNFDSVVG